MESKLKLKNADGSTLTIDNNDALLTDKEVSYFNTITANNYIVHNTIKGK